jgi:hypothetical protein
LSQLPLKFDDDEQQRKMVHAAEINFIVWKIRLFAAAACFTRSVLGGPGNETRVWRFCR